MGSYLARLVMPAPAPTYGPDAPWLRWVAGVPYSFVPNSMTAIVVSHGNMEDIGMLQGRARAIAAATGASVFCYEYPGYGVCADAPVSFAGATENLRTLVGYLRYLGYERVVLVGQSIGSGPTCEVAAEGAADGVVLVTPFRSLLGSKLRWSLGCLDAFHNHRHMAEITVPVAVVHGTEDCVVPCWQGEELYAAARRRAGICVVDGAGHNNLFSGLYAAQTLDAIHAAVECIERAAGAADEPPARGVPAGGPARERVDG